ncbi:DUF1684 domain-containing protein [Tenacibaculum sp. IB213877]|uniref:DUF1684 domain-containing protein n=1 Tax=Tenacibaculum sp. IB213877 TaxID=3097351 RepID=UPI002A5A8DF6|nr:DUF1684 domain-containing protein [Tenacibaculum sp. IB213877]MDY0780265.1 DUF1684 domain-containing protein [Tenacibaculum sp. IB213877]
MKQLLTLLIFSVLVSCNSQNKRAPLGKSEFQRKLNADFKDASKSPLTKKGLKNFKGLDFFPINDTFKVQAKLTKTPDAPLFKFPTTTDRIATYKKYGIVNFTINGQDFQLDIYQDEKPKPEYKDYLFLPFLDKTNGKTSYSGGRFVEVFTSDENKDGTITIDFNKAYNPYCAYSNRYSCPITPRNNYLDIEVNAGVMAYDKK